MQRYFFSLRIALIVIAAGIMVAAIDLHWRGFVVVRDPGEQVGGVTLEGTGAPIELREFAAGYWAGRPRRQSVIVLRCRNGMIAQRRAVEPGEQASYVVGADDCRARR